MKQKRPMAPPPPKMVPIDLTQPIIDPTKPILVDLTLEDDDVPPTHPIPPTPNGLKNHFVSTTKYFIAVKPKPQALDPGATLVKKLIPLDTSKPLGKLRNLSPLPSRVTHPVGSSSQLNSWKLQKGSRPPLEEIERRWNALASDAGAASISFVNDIDEDKFPPGAAQFHYLESSFL